MMTLVKETEEYKIYKDENNQYFIQDGDDFYEIDEMFLDI